MSKILEHSDYIGYMIKIQQVRCSEGGPFSIVQTGGVANATVTGLNNKAKIEIGEYLDICDLTTSQVVVRARAYCTSNFGNGADSGNGNQSTLIPVVIGQWDADSTQQIGGAKALFQQVRVVSDKYGLLNQQSYQNVKQANVDYYTTGRVAKTAASQTYTGGSDKYDQQFDMEVPTAYSPFFQYSKPAIIDVTVDTDSVSHLADVRAPLSTLDERAAFMAKYPFTMMGNHSIYIEQLENRQPILAPIQNDTPVTIEDMNSVGGYIGNGAAPLINLLPGNIGYTQASIGKCPLWVGAPILLTYTEAAQPAKTHYDTVSELTVTAAGQLSIVLATGAQTTVAAAAVTDISLTIYVSNTAEFQIDIQDIFVNLHQYRFTPKQREAQLASMRNVTLPYLSTKWQAFNMAQGPYYSQTFHVDPNCVGVVALTPLDESLISSWDEVVRYKWSINGIPTTEPDVGCGVFISNQQIGAQRQLHNLLLERWFDNMAIPPNNRRLVRFDGWDDNADVALGAMQLNNHSMYATIVPLMDRPAMIVLQLFASNDMYAKTVHYFSYHLNFLSFKDGMLVSK